MHATQAGMNLALPRCNAYLLTALMSAQYSVANNKSKIQAWLHGAQAVKRSDNLLSREELTPAKQQAHLEAATCLAGVLHATGDSDGAAAQCQTALTLVHDDDASGGILPKSAVAAALKHAAALRLAQVKVLGISFKDAHAFKDVGLNTPLQHLQNLQKRFCELLSALSRYSERYYKL